MKSNTSIKCIVKNASIFACLLLACWLSVNAQTQQPFKAGWIAPPGVQLHDYGVYHFRKTLSLANRPSRFMVHVSADNRYRLLVNGVSVACGPQRSDVAHWRYETINLAPFLKKGNNIIAVTVWNQGKYAAWAQISLQTGLWVKGEAQAAIVNSDTSWRVSQDLAYSPIATAQHITGPFDQIDAARYLWGWEQLQYNDKHWDKAIVTEQAVPFKSDTAQTRQMLEQNIPLPQERPQRFASVRKAEGVTLDDGFLQGTKPLNVAANSNVTLLIDQGILTTAYPELLVSGGKGSKITLTYAEALFADKDGQKGNRNDIEGKHIAGDKDEFILDGRDHRLFSTLYYRTFRYVEAKIANGQFPLTINGLSSRFTGYPFKENASFTSSDPSLHRLWNVGWRTARLCAFETYMDCPYYEQQQYVGDTRIQALISLYVSGDDRLMKNAISEFNQSRIGEGLTQSRYPCNVKQVIPPFSLFWIGMLHDYQMIGSDQQFIKNLLPGVAQVLNWHRQYISPQGMLYKMPYWNFVDWPKEWPWTGDENTSGIPPGAITGNSAILTLQYVCALNYAAELFKSFGQLKEAKDYSALALQLKTATYTACWDAQKQMLADSPEKTSFSQHANAMAVLAGAIPAADEKRLLLAVESNPDITQCTLYYRFYLIQAFKKAGLGNEYLRLLKPWYQMLNLGLTTFAERPEPTRSDCHGWSASPDYDLLATVAGITPLKPGFKAVRIAPEMGSLTWIDAAMPHPLGQIKVHLQKKGDLLTGTINLPKGLYGEFVWGGKTLKLKEGVQQVQL